MVFMGIAFRVRVRGSPPSLTHITTLPHSHYHPSHSHLHPPSLTSPPFSLTCTPLSHLHVPSSLTHNPFSLPHMPPSPHTHTCTQDLVNHYQRDSDGLAQRLSIPCPRFNQPATVGLSYRYITIATHQRDTHIHTNSAKFLILPLPCSMIRLKE